MNEDILETYRQYLNRQPISAHTRRSYLQRVKGFLEWLTGVSDGKLALSDLIERDFQLREYKQFLLQRGASASTINGILSAIGNFDLSRGVQPAKVKRLELPRQAPRVLTPDEERRLLKTLERRSLRDKCLIMLMWHTGLRISELAALNIDDIALTARTGTVTVRCGKGLKTRTIPLNGDLRQVLQVYFAEQVARGSNEALFLSQKKSRLSLPSIDRIVRGCGLMSGIELSAHDLRHCFISSLTRLGTDIVMIAELTGHSRIETIRRYALPTEEQKQAALEKLCRYAS